MAERLGRPPKFSTEELMRRLCDAGVEAILAQGLDFGLGAVRLDTAISEAEVPRRAAYSLFASNESSRTPQDAFRRTVLIHILRETPLSTGLGMTRSLAVEEIARHQQAIESGDPVQLSTAFRECIRVVADANFNALDGSHLWQVYRTAANAIATQPEPDPEIIRGLRDGEENLIAGYAEFFAQMATIFALKIKPEFTIAEFAASTYALNEGLANRPSRTYRNVGIELPSSTGPKPWTLMAVGFEALVWQFWTADWRTD